MDSELPETGRSYSESDAQTEESEADDSRAEEDRLESDGDATPPEPIADEEIVDGRLSGLPPVYDDGADDPSAREAGIQESDSQGTEHG